MVLGFETVLHTRARCILLRTTRADGRPWGAVVVRSLQMDPRIRIRQPRPRSGTARCLLPPPRSFILHEHHLPPARSPRLLRTRRASFLQIPPTVLAAACQSRRCWVRMRIDRRARQVLAQCFRVQRSLLLPIALGRPRLPVSCPRRQRQAGKRRWSTPCFDDRRPPTDWPLRTNHRLLDHTDQTRGSLRSHRCPMRLDSAHCRDRSLFRSIPRSRPLRGCRRRFRLQNPHTWNPDD